MAIDAPFPHGGSPAVARALTTLVAAARAGGEIALAAFRHGAQTSARVDYKHGGSPVTEADMAVDAFLKTRLGAAFPEAGWLSEETADDDARLKQAKLLVVDPIDGTRAFLSGDPRWAVSIALVRDGKPIAGVIHAPALSQTFTASLGGGAALNGVAIQASGRTELARARIGGPKPMVDAIAAAVGAELVGEPKIPSLAYRLARVAEGSLDGALASGNSHDWDVAAADIVLSEAGALLCDINGRPLTYNLAETRRGALAAAPRALAPALAGAMREAISRQRHET